MLSQCFVPSITKNVISYSFLDNNHLQPFKCKILIKVFHYILKSLETFFIQNYYYHYYYYYYYYFYGSTEEARGSREVFHAILCQNGRMSYEKQGNDFHI